MQHTRQTISLHRIPTSLCWNGDTLVDRTDGNRIIDLAKGDLGTRRGWGFPFDSAVQSPSGRFAVVYQRLGTKGLLLQHGEILREINRSYYHADVYHYPVTFAVDSCGRELLVHCPDKYNRIDIELAETGENLTRHVHREPDDMFHSRLAVSPGNKRLLSAGWVWHPSDEVAVWSLADVLMNPTQLDKSDEPWLSFRCEVSDAVFLDDDRLLCISNPDADDYSEAQLHFRPGYLGVWNLNTQAFETIAPITEPLGLMMPLGRDHVVAFFGSPRLVHIPSGCIVHAWSDLNTCKRSGSICRAASGDQPAIALDPANRRFAVAIDNGVTIIQVTDPGL